MLVSPLAAQSQRKSPARAQPPKVEDSGPSTPLPLSAIEEGIDKIKRGGIAIETWLIGQIEHRGVDFSATPANLEALDKRGASPRLLDAIRKKSPPPPPSEPEPPPKPAGVLSVRCAPAECEIEINGQPAGITKDGAFTKTELDVGRATVDFKKRGYVPVRREMEVVAEARPPVEVTLEPDASTKAAFGKQLLALMLRAIGITEASQVRNLTATGAVTSYAEGQETEWNFALTMSAPASVDMDLSNSSGTFSYQCIGDGCADKRTKGGGLFGRGGPRPLTETAAEPLRMNLRAFSRYHFAATLEEILSSPARLSAPSASRAEDGSFPQLRVETPDSVYLVSLENDWLPTAITCQSKAGLGSAIKIIYSHYTGLGSARYPTRTIINLMDAGKHGIDVRLEQLKPGSSLPQPRQ